MKEFSFFGALPASKSILNRALIVQSYFPDLKIEGDSACADVVFLKSALRQLSAHQALDCGEGGTSFRFMALRASRKGGDWDLRAHPRLLKRPQQQIVDILKQLNVPASLHSQGMKIQSSGWKDPKGPVLVDGSQSSQYASALLLNSWQLDFPLSFQFTGERISEGYFEMTLAAVRALGMQVEVDGNLYRIPAHQKISNWNYRAESDLSSAFVFAAAGALLGQATIQNFPTESLQPDHAFKEILQQMGVACHIHVQEQKFHVHRSLTLRGLEWNLAQTPDLFPVLAVLCSFAEGPSQLFGAPHLALKESNRIQKTSELLRLFEIPHETKTDGMWIDGNPRLADSLRDFPTFPLFDTAHDHRMVMAAALLKRAGAPLSIQYPESVDKSFPEFFDLFGVMP